MANTLFFKKFLTFFCVLALLTVCLAPCALAAEPVEVGSESIYVTELESGNTLKSINENAKFNPGSITKLMTLYAIASSCYDGKAALDDVVTITSDVMSSDSGVIPLKEGEEFTLEQLMYLMYMDYSDTAGIAAAVHVAGSYDSFVSLMNRTARSLGMENTHFANILGSFNEEQYTTAKDLVTFLNAAIQNSVFLQVFSDTTYLVPDTNKSISRSLVSGNSLQKRSSSYYSEQCDGGRNGGFSDYGFATLSLSETQDSNMKLIVVTAGNASRDGAYEDAHKLIEWTYNNFSWQTIATVSDNIAKVPIEMGDGSDYVVASPESDVVVMLDDTIPENSFKKEIVIYSEITGEKLVAPIEKGEILGELKITYRNETIGQVRLVANKNIELAKKAFFKSEVERTFKSSKLYWAVIIILILVVLYLIYSIIFYVLRVVKYFKKRQDRQELVESRRRGFYARYEANEEYDDESEKTRIVRDDDINF